MYAASYLQVAVIYFQQVQILMRRLSFNRVCTGFCRSLALYLERCCVLSYNILDCHLRARNPC